MKSISDNNHTKDISNRELQCHDHSLSLTLQRPGNVCAVCWCEFLLLLFCLWWLTSSSLLKLVWPIEWVWLGVEIKQHCLSVPHSIQRAAAWVLDQYYSDFPVHNPSLLNLPKSILTRKMSAFKVYNLEEGKNNHTPTSKAPSGSLGQKRVTQSTTVIRTTPDNCSPPVIWSGWQSQEEMGHKKIIERYIYIFISRPLLFHTRKLLVQIC